MLTWLRNQMKQGTYQNSAVLPDLSEEEIPQRGVSHSRQFEEQHQTKEDFQMINYISGLVFTILFVIGKFSSVKGPGIFLIIPIIDQVKMVDLRILAMDIPAQQVITRDNVPVKINGVLFFKVQNAADAIIKVQDYRYAIGQYAQTSLRDVIGQMTLDQLLVEREEIGKSIESNVEKDTRDWGLEVTGIRMQDVDMPEELKKMMSRQASAEREKRATITKAEGDREAAINLAVAARTMTERPGAMQLRTLQTVDGLGPTASNTVVLAVPVNIMEAVDQLTQALKTKNQKS